jgi:FecR protein
MAIRQEPSTKSRALAVAATLLFTCLPVAPALAQVNVCVLSPDKRSPNDKILRCGAALTVRPAPDTLYRPLDAGSNRPPDAVQLDSGALLIEFHPAGKRRDFQILTPHAIAAVRGTRWAVEVKPGQSSVFVLSGAVQVARASTRAAVLLRPGQGVDVTDADGPLQVKRWAPERVRALLARFGP